MHTFLTRKLLTPYTTAEIGGDALKRTYNYFLSQLGDPRYRCRLPRLPRPRNHEFRGIQCDVYR